MNQVAGAPARPSPAAARPDPVAGVGAALELIARECFPAAGGTLVGAELEWLVTDPRAPGRRLSAGELAAVLGPHAPGGAPLPGGAAVTVEPGSQLELSSAPHPGARALVTSLRADQAHLAALLRRGGLVLRGVAADTGRDPLRVLSSPRYTAMEAAFDRVGPFGRLMMTNTAAVQVCVGLGAADGADGVDGARAAAGPGLRWSVLHAAGPALLAAFARSPRLRGAPAGAWASQRMRAWLHLDPARTDPAADGAADPAAAYARWAVGAPLLCVRREGPDWSAPPGASLANWLAGDLDAALGRRPTADDVRYHLSTLFPPVRPKGYLEVRYLDQQPGGQWRGAVAAVAALVASRRAAELALEAAAPTRGMWRAAAEAGLADRRLRRAAADVLAVASAAEPDPLLRGYVDAHRERIEREWGNSGS